MASKLKIIILTEKTSGTTCDTIQALAAMDRVEVAAIFLDEGASTFRQRLKNLRRNIRREGPGYLVYRLASFVEERLDHKANGMISSSEVRRFLEQVYPERVFRIQEFADRLGVPIHRFGNLNAPEVGERIRSLGADLGVVLGTRVLKRPTFAAPRLGSINLHKGKVPEYRGQPPGFWELWDGQSSAGVTVHQVDDSLDTGDILGEEAIPIHPKDNPITLRRKLDLAGTRLMCRCVLEVAEGRAVPRPQVETGLKPRKAPTRRQQTELYRRLGVGHFLKRQAPSIAKTFYGLCIFYGGIFHLLRAWRRWRGRNRACILLYHRVNEICEDVLTTKIHRFAQHLLALKKYYQVVPLSSLESEVKHHAALGSRSVAITFDDCYKDVYTEASRMLSSLGFPACSFISSGFVGTDRIFEHDAEKYPIRLDNLDASDLQGLLSRGFEIGAHTVNHVNLGTCSEATAALEIGASKKGLEALVRRPVTAFSFPFGREENIRPEVVNLIRDAGFHANYSAHGGYVGADADLFDLPRVPASDQFRPLDLLLEIEGLSLGVLKRRLLRG